jgi:hypothetical protein
MMVALLRTAMMATHVLLDLSVPTRVCALLVLSTRLESHLPLALLVQLVATVTKLCRLLVRPVFIAMSLPQLDGINNALSVLTLP